MRILNAKNRNAIMFSILSTVFASSASAGETIDLKCISEPTQNSLNKFLTSYITIDKTSGIIKSDGLSPTMQFPTQETYRWVVESPRSAVNIASDIYYTIEHTLHRQTGKLSSVVFILNSNGAVRSRSSSRSQCDVTQSLDL
jgi:hypothetical protein